MLRLLSTKKTNLNLFRNFTDLLEFSKIPPLSSLSISSISLLSIQFTSKPRLLSSEARLSIDCLNELISRLSSNSISLSEFISSARNFSNTLESTSLLTNLLRSLIKERYLNMEELSEFLRLVYIDSKSTDLDLCKKALYLLDQRTSHTYDSKVLIKSIETCSNLSSVCDDAQTVLNKIHMYMLHKVEFADYQQHIQMLEIFNKAERIDKSMLLTCMKSLYGLESDDYRKMTMSELESFVVNIAELMKKKYVYVNLPFRLVLLNELGKIAAENKIRDVRLGHFFDAIKSVFTTIPENIVKFASKALKEQKVIDYSFVLCYHSMFMVNRKDFLFDLTEEMEKSLKNQSTVELINIYLNSTSRYSSSIFLKRISAYTQKLLASKCGSGDYDVITEILDYLSRNSLHRKYSNFIFDKISECFVHLQKRNESLDKFAYFNILMKHFDLTENFKDILIPHINSFTYQELTSLLNRKENYGFKALNFLITHTNLSDYHKLLFYFINLNDNVPVSDFLDSAKIINRLSGSIYSADYFEFYLNNFFNYIFSKDLEPYFRGFFEALAGYMNSLEDSQLHSSKSLKVLYWFKLLEFVDVKLTDRVLSINIDNYIDNQEAYLVLSTVTSSQEIKDFISQKIVPELNHSWSSLDTTELTKRIIALSDLNWISQKDKDNIKKSLVYKFTKIYSFYFDDITDVLSILKDRLFQNNLRLIEHILDQITFRVKRNELVLSTKAIIDIFSNLSKFTTKSPELYKFLFTDIGKLFYKFGIDQKIDIILALARRGIINNAISKAVLDEINKHQELNYEYYIDALLASADAELENTEFYQKVFEMLVFKKNTENISQNSRAKLIYVLSKSEKHLSFLKESIKTFSLDPIFYIEYPSKLLASYYYLNSKGISIGNSEEVNTLHRLVSTFSQWGVNTLLMSPILSYLSAKNIEYKTFAEIENMRVPILIPSSNTVVVPLTPYNSTFDMKKLKGEHKMIVQALQNKKIKTLIIDSNNIESILNS